MDRVFVDTGAFIALVATTDKHHKEAEAIYRKLVGDKIQLVTSNHIVDETCTFLLRDKALGHATAVRFGNFIKEASTSCRMDDLTSTLLSDARFILIYSCPTIEQKAWDVFAKYDDAGFTFTDCTSFAAMTLLEVSNAFTFDSHFDIMGFKRVQV